MLPVNPDVQATAAQLYKDRGCRLLVRARAIGVRKKDLRHLRLHSADISQMTSRFAEIIPPYHRRGNRVFSAANRWPDFSVFLCLEGHLSIFSTIQTYPSCRFHWPSISPAYAGTGLRRKSSIRLRMFRNKFLGTATSASWKVTYRPWLTTLAPILISFSRSVVYDQCSTSFENAR